MLCACYAAMNVAKGVNVDESLDRSDDRMNHRIFVQPLHVFW